MKSIFISQPMQFRNEQDIRSERQKIIDKLSNIYGKNNIEIIDSYHCDWDPLWSNPAWFLGKSIELLSTADMAYFAEGWELSRGCRIEHQVAREYGIEVIYGDEI